MLINNFSDIISKLFGFLIDVMEKIIYNNKLLKECKNKKIDNINAFCSLDRTNLGFGDGKVQRKLFIRRFTTGEKLFIIYPGKETARTPKRPYDFYPQLILSNGIPIKTTSFQDVWDDIFILSEDKFDMYALATIFVRMAYMLDSKKVKKNFEYQDILYGEIIANGILELEFYEYSPAKSLYTDLGIPIDTVINGANIIPYLMYNDFIAQNEDCKYYYIDVKEKGKRWNSNKGRTNTCLTHVSVIALIKHLYTFAKIMGKFQNGRGIAPISKQYFSEITKSRICYNKQEC